MKIGRIYCMINTYGSNHRWENFLFMKPNLAPEMTNRIKKLTKYLKVSAH